MFELQPLYYTFYPEEMLWTITHHAILVPSSISSVSLSLSYWTLARQNLCIVYLRASMPKQAHKTRLERVPFELWMNTHHSISDWKFRKLDNEFWEMIGREVSQLHLTIKIK